MIKTKEEALRVAYEQGLHGRRRDWLHNLGAAFEQQMNEAYERGKAEKIRLARAAMAAKKG